MLRATSAALLGVVVLGLVAPSGTALAQAKPDFDAAKKHYLAGKNAAATHDYDNAIREYILAYDITKDPTLFKQIGQAYEAEGKKTEAAVYYRRYLNEAKGGDDEVRARIVVLEGKESKPSDSKRSPNEEEPAKLPPPESPTAASSEFQLSQPPLPGYGDEGVRWQRTAAWISVGLAAAAATTGGILTVSANSRQDDIRQLIAFRDPVTGQQRAFSGTTKDDYQSKIDEGNRLQNFATAAFIGAGACAAAATLFFILDATRSVPRERVSLQPVVSPGSAGMAASWEF